MEGTVKRQKLVNKAFFCFCIIKDPKYHSRHLLDALKSQFVKKWVRRCEDTNMRQLSGKRIKAICL